MIFIGMVGTQVSILNVQKFKGCLRIMQESAPLPAFLCINDFKKEEVHIEF